MRTSLRLMRHKPVTVFWLNIPAMAQIPLSILRFHVHQPQALLFSNGPSNERVNLNTHIWDVALLVGHRDPEMLFQ